MAMVSNVTTAAGEAADWWDPSCLSHSYHFQSSQIRHRVPPLADLTDCRCSQFVLVGADVLVG